MDDESNQPVEEAGEQMDSQVDEAEQSETSGDDSDQGAADDAADDAPESGKFVPREEHENLKKALAEERAKNRETRQAPPAPAPQRQYDPNDLSDVTNADGSIDPLKFARKIEQGASMRARAERAEERQWEEAVKEFPELNEDTDLQEAVRGLRDRKLVQTGEFMTLSDAAKRILGKTRSAEAKAKEEGRKEAQVSETIQKRTGVDRPSNKQTDAKADRLADIKARMYKGSNKEREAARLEYLQTAEL